PEAFGPPKTKKHDADSASSDAGVADADAGAAAAHGGGTGDASKTASPDEGVVWAIPSERPLLGLEPLPLRHPGKLAIDKDAKAHVLLSLPETSDDAESARPAGVVVRHGQG